MSTLPSNRIPRSRHADLLPFAFTLAAVMAGAPMAGSGCGGGLKYTVDDAAMDTVPADERQGVSAARKEAEVAENERRKAETQLEALDRDTDVAKKEREQAELEIEKSVAEQEGAKVSRDENQANSAAHHKDMADMGLKVAEAKLDWLSQKKDWLKQARVAAESHVEAAKARVEYEKAKVAEQRGIKLSTDFSPSDYEDQWHSRKSDWDSERKDAESEEKDAKKKEDQWRELADKYQKLRG